MGIIMAILQFKRVFNYTGSMENALYNIKNNLDPALADGEPLVCSYTEDGTTKYFLAVGAGNDKVVVYPAFNDKDDFISYIKEYANVDLTEIISEDSDFVVTLDPETNKYILKIKDSLLCINWIQL